MNTAQKGLVANIVGIIVLLLANFGINVDAESAKILVDAIAIAGLIINQLLHVWEVRRAAKTQNGGA